MPRVTFYPYNISMHVQEGKILLDAIVEGGIPINAVCGGRGECGKCRVYAETAIPEDILLSLLNGNFDGIDFVLACQTVVDSSMEVFIPPSSVTEGMKVLTKSEKPEMESLDPLLKKCHLTLPPPTLEDNISDVERIKRELSRQGMENINIPLDKIQYLGKNLRDANWDVTLSLS